MITTSMDPLYITQASIGQLLSALEERLANIDHPANSETITMVEVDCYKKRARAIPKRFDTLRNALAPLHKLPAELLLQIFRLLQPPRHPFTDYYGMDKDTELGWLSITKVCGYWRSIALGSPSLWQTITIPKRGSYQLQHWFFDNSEPMTTHLSRHNFTKKQIPFIHRLESLDLTISNWRGVQWDVLGYAITSPNFTTLSLRRDGYNEDVRIVPQILGGQPSNVKKLFLSSLWCWPANAGTFQNISYLVLSLREIDIIPLLEIMDTCHSLEALHLIELEEWDVPDPEPTFSFTQLKLLILETCPVFGNPYCARHLRFSSAVEIYAYGPLIPEINGFVVKLGTELTGPIALLDLHFDINRNSQFSLKGTSARFSLDYEDFYDEGWSNLDDVSRPFPRTKELRFSGTGGYIGPAYWWEQAGLVDFFRYLPNLLTIRFDTETNYLAVLDAIFRSSQSRKIKEVFVQEMAPLTSYNDNFTEAEWARLMKYQEARVTTIQHSCGTSSYRLVVEPLAAGKSRYQVICIPEVPP